MLDGAFHRLFRAQELKRAALPGFDPSHVLRGEGGVCVGVMDAHVERMAGQLIVHAHPADVGMPQVMVEAQGTGDDAGVALTVAVDRLAIVGGKGSKVPTMKVRRVSVRCQVAVSARLRYAEGRWTVDGFSTSLKKWSAPGVLTRTTASLVLKLVRPTLRERVRAALAPELGDFVLELRSPLVVAGEFEVEAAPADGVASAPGRHQGDSTSLQRERSARARSGKSTHASRALRGMIARPKISRNERKTTERGAFEVGHVAPFCCPGRRRSVATATTPPRRGGSWAGPWTRRGASTRPSGRSSRRTARPGVETNHWFGGS